MENLKTKSKSWNLTPIEFKNWSDSMQNKGNKQQNHNFRIVNNVPNSLGRS